MKLRTLILTAIFAALTAIGAFIRIPLPMITITLQFLFTAMAGILLGKKYGALSQAIYVLLGLFGLPVFTEGGGLYYVLKPSFGFLLGLILSAFLIGLLCEKKKTFWQIVLACLVGLAALYTVGFFYLAAINAFVLQKDFTLWGLFCAVLVPCLPGDILKILCASFLGERLLKILHR